MKKGFSLKLIALMLLICCLSAVFANTVLAEDEAIGKAICTAKSSMNLRSGPGTSYSKAGTLPAKAEVEVFEKSGNWYKIEYNGKLSWASGDYLKVTMNGPSPSTPSTEPVPSAQAIGKAICTAKSSMNLRSGPGTSYSKAGTLPAKAAVEVFEKSGNWYKIEYNGKLVWASGDYLKVTMNGPSPSTPSTEPVPSAQTIGKAICTAKSSMNLRSGPGTSYSTAGTLPAKAEVEVFEKSGNWYKVEYNGKLVWASGDYLKVSIYPEPEEPDEPGTLKLGSTGEEVNKLQKRMIELGYMRAESDSADVQNVYGEKTAHAVKLFKRQHGIKENGKADPATLEVIYSDSAKPCKYPLAGYVIGLDPGHQAKSNSEQEPVSPGSKETKKKVSSGTQGVYTKVEEYKVNLAIGLRLKELLEEAGAIVKMTRETNDVNISNAERACFFNEEKTDYALRLHCNGSENTSKVGAFMLVPEKNPYKEDCDRAAQLLIDAYCAETDFKNLGITERSDQTGFNWCERMIINIEMGHMSNKSEDIRLCDAAVQEKMAQGIYKGILAYFE